MDRVDYRSERSVWDTLTQVLVTWPSSDTLLGKVIEMAKSNSRRVLEITAPFPSKVFWEGRKRQEAHTHCMCVTVSSMFVASWFVAAVGWGPVVHEPLETNRHHVRTAQSVWRTVGKAATGCLVYSKWRGNRWKHLVTGTEPKPLSRCKLRQQQWD